jgi:hypothetical protein
MAEAVARYQAGLEGVSFKATVDAWRQYGAASLQARSRKLRDRLWEDLRLNLVRDLVPTAPTAPQLAPSNVVPNPSRCSPNRGTNSKRPLPATASGDHGPAIVAAQTKRHSRIDPF